MKYLSETVVDLNNFTVMEEQVIKKLEKIIPNLYEKLLDKELEKCLRVYGSYMH